MKDKYKITKKISNALNANDLVSAREIIEKDLKKVASKDEYYFYLGIVSEDNKEKIGYYSKAIKNNPNFMDAYINRGHAYTELAEYEKSIQDYNKAIELDSKCALAYNNRGYTKFKQEDYDGALKDYNKAILLNPKLKMALDNKATLFQTVCMKDDADFSEKYYLSLGIMEITNGNFEEGIKELDESLKYNQNSDIVYFYKGVAYHSAGKNDEAIDSYTKSIELNKKMIDAYYNRGQLLMSDNPKLALDDFVSAVALDSKFIDAYYAIASVQKKLGQYNEAIKNLDKIIELEPNAINAKALKKLIQNKYL